MSRVRWCQIIHSFQKPIYGTETAKTQVLEFLESLWSEQIKAWKVFSGSLKGLELLEFNFLESLKKTQVLESFWMGPWKYLNLPSLKVLKQISYWKCLNVLSLKVCEKIKALKVFENDFQTSWDKMKLTAEQTKRVSLYMIEVWLADGFSCFIWTGCDCVLLFSAGNPSDMTVIIVIVAVVVLALVAIAVIEYFIYKKNKGERPKQKRLFLIKSDIYNCNNINNLSFLFISAKRPPSRK